MREALLKILQTFTLDQVKEGAGEDSNLTAIEANCCSIILAFLNKKPKAFLAFLEQDLNTNNKRKLATVQKITDEDSKLPAITFNYTKNNTANNAEDLPPTTITNLVRENISKFKNCTRKEINSATTNIAKDYIEQAQDLLNTFSVSKRKEIAQEYRKATGELHGGGSPLDRRFTGWLAETYLPQPDRTTPVIELVAKSFIAQMYNQEVLSKTLRVLEVSQEDLTYIFPAWLVSK